MKKVKFFMTARNSNDRLSEKEPPFFSKQSNECLPVLEIDSDVTYQTIEGFGGAFTEAGGYNLSTLSQEKREEVIKSYFSPEVGLGYSLCRTHINSCDFSLGNYAYNNVPGDTKLKKFDISRDKKYLTPFIHDAMKVNCSNFKLIASPWSPPAWMKSNGKINNGGKLLNKYYDVWALYIAKYIEKYNTEGIDIWEITVQNEPDATQVWESCRYSAIEERDFIKEHLKPVLVKHNLDNVKIMIWDFNRDQIYERAKIILSDPKAASFIWGIGFHWYSGEQFKNVAKVYKIIRIKN